MFGDIPDGKGTFQDYKTSIIETRKICVFRKRLVHGLSKKFAIYSSFLFNRNRPRKRVSYVNEV